MIRVDIDYELLGKTIAELLQPQGTPWMTVAEAAEYMRVSERFLRERLSEIPHCRVDKKLLLHRREIDSWLTNHRRETS